MADDEGEVAGGHRVAPIRRLFEREARVFLRGAACREIPGTGGAVVHEETREALRREG